jgi:hypothetical protein
MTPQSSATYSATFKDRALQIRASGSGYSWSVTNSTTGEKVAQGEASDRESAMVAAAEAAQADWGAIRWRGARDEDQD